MHSRMSHSCSQHVYMQISKCFSLCNLCDDNLIFRCVDLAGNLPGPILWICQRTPGPILWIDTTLQEAEPGALLSIGKTGKNHLDPFCQLTKLACGGSWTPFVNWQNMFGPIFQLAKPPSTPQKRQQRKNFANWQNLPWFRWLESQTCHYFHGSAVVGHRFVCI